MERNQDSIRTTVKKINSRFLKGANPKKAVRNGYEKTCDYLDILNKRILIQQRALACQSKTSAHTFSRGRCILWEIQSSLAYLGDTRCQEHQMSRTPLFGSQLVQEGEVFLL